VARLGPPAGWETVINVIAVARPPPLCEFGEDECKGHRPLVVECNECNECSEYEYDEYDGSKGYDLSIPLSVGLVSDLTDAPPAVPPLTIAGIREMGGDKSTKLQKYHKPRLIESIV
jgi:hypothetical protein